MKYYVVKHKETGKLAASISIVKPWATRSLDVAIHLFKYKNHADHHAMRLNLTYPKNSMPWTVVKVDLYSLVGKG